MEADGCIEWSSQRNINDIDALVEPMEPGPEPEQEKTKLLDKIRDVEKDLKFYKSLFETHHNSCLFNMRIKYLKGEQVWVDPTRDTCEYISNLDVDDDIKGWLKPTKCER